VGVAEAASASYPDPSVPLDQKDQWHVIDVRWTRWLPAPVPISRMRAARALGRMRFLIMPRLSISPVTATEWKTIVSMSDSVDRVQN
jgi:predicted RNA-binding protein with PUA-like domain